MELLKSNILIISFYFPPFDRVGGRRWAKHAKYLQAKGVKFWVLASDIDNSKSPTWNKDILTYKDKIVRIPARIKYPYFKKKLPQGFIDKVIWTLSLKYWQQKEKNTPGNLWDDSDGYQQAYCNKACQIIEQKKITQVIISIGPYHYASIISLLKQKFPQVKFIVDYRDYWEDGMEALNEEKKQYEMQLQRELWQATDAIITVNDEMKTFYQDKINSHQVFTLPHCYDPSDMLPVENVKEQPKPKKELRFIYGGSLYGQMDRYISLFGDFVGQLKSSGYEVTVDFYVTKPAYESILEKHQIKLHGYIPLDQYFQKMKQADFVLFFRPDWSPNAFSSKFFEMVAMRKPVLYFGPQSDVSNLLQKNKLGIHFDPTNFETSLRSFVNDLSLNTIPDLNYNINQHTFEYQTGELIKFLNGL